MVRFHLIESSSFRGAYKWIFKWFMFSQQAEACGNEKKRKYALSAVGFVQIYWERRPGRISRRAPLWIHKCFASEFQPVNTTGVQLQRTNSHGIPTLLLCESWPWCRSIQGGAWWHWRYGPKVFWASSAGTLNGTDNKLNKQWSEKKIMYNGIKLVLNGRCKRHDEEFEMNMLST